jgi:hypothetical protein
VSFGCTPALVTCFNSACLQIPLDLYKQYKVHKWSFTILLGKKYVRSGQHTVIYVFAGGFVFEIKVKFRVESLRCNTELAMLVKDVSWLQ